MLKSINIANGQSIYDINLSLFGGFSNIIKFCQDNNIRSLNQFTLNNVNFDTNNIENKLIAGKSYITGNSVLIDINSLLNNDGTPLLNNDGTPLLNN